MSAPSVRTEASDHPARSLSPDAQMTHDGQVEHGVGVSSVSGAHRTCEDQELSGTPDGVLMFYAEALDDLERTRIAFENRARSIVQAAGPEVAEEQMAMAGALKMMEHQATLQLQRAMRKHPLGAHVKATVGLGEKQAARLLASIGDPAWHPGTSYPDGSWNRKPGWRTLRELYAFCGLHVLDRPKKGSTASDTPAGQGSAPDAHWKAASHRSSGAGASSATTAQEVIDSHYRTGGVAPSRTKGQKANWSNDAKMRVYLIAEACLKAKARSPYGPVYDNGRTKYADAVHSGECRRCGPKGKPALEGSPLSAGHQHARAMRLVMKAVLRDLWIAARASKAVPDSQSALGARAAELEAVAS